MTLLTGLAYPFAMTGIAQVDLPAPGERQPDRARRHRDRLVSSIGQPFTGDALFPPRPSARRRRLRCRQTRRGSQSRTDQSPRSIDAARTARPRIAPAAQRPAASVPVDLVTASGSGLDPHISPAAAEFQVARVAAARGMPEPAVRNLVADHIEGRDPRRSSASRVSMCCSSISHSTPWRPDGQSEYRPAPGRRNDGSGMESEPGPRPEPGGAARRGREGGARPAQDLPRRRIRASARPTPCCRRRRNAAARAPTSSSASSRPTAAPRPRRCCSGLEILPRRHDRLSRPRRSPRWISTPSCARQPAARAGRRARAHQRARLAATPSAGRTSRSCSTPASTSTPRSTSSTSRA